jgi:TolB-like protein
VRFNNAIAVLPPVDADGDETVGGKYFAEQLCAELVRNHVTVVERMLLGKAIDELVRQQGREFNEKTAEEIGKQVGAYAIATGSLLKRGNRIGARLRLIQVATGKVVMTAARSCRLPGPSRGPSRRPSCAPQWVATMVGPGVRIFPSTVMTRSTRGSPLRILRWRRTCGINPRDAAVAGRIHHSHGWPTLPVGFLQIARQAAEVGS